MFMHYTCKLNYSPTNNKKYNRFYLLMTILLEMLNCFTNCTVWVSFLLGIHSVAISEFRKLSEILNISLFAIFQLKNA